MAKTLREIMDSIHEMQQNGSMQEIMDDKTVQQYVSNEMEGVIVSPDNKAAKYVADLMARNPKIRRELKDSLPAADAARKTKMENLHRDASREGMDKLWNDFLGTKKRNAKKELQEIARDQANTAGPTEARDAVTYKTPDDGRKRYVLTSAVNAVALGSKDERHPENNPCPLPDNVDNIISHETPDGVLSGLVYAPDDPNAPKSDKVVIFFSGSGGTSNEFVGSVAKEYMKTGAKVVAMDYRGFGDSLTTDRNGHKIGTPLSENSIYKDGKAMLDYVINEMHVKPENIILHGYSLGGAVASKVAADYAQEQNQLAIQNDTPVQSHLGGVVLHSPIASMYEAAKDQALGIHFIGMGGWAFGGGYNTRSHMQRLHEMDPDMPVHYVSGEKKKGDHLDIDDTKIDKDPKAQFKNSSRYRGQGGHFGNNVKNDMGLRNIVYRDRNAQMGGPQMHRQQPGSLLGN